MERILYVVSRHEWDGLVKIYPDYLDADASLAALRAQVTLALLKRAPTARVQTEVTDYFDSHHLLKNGTKVDDAVLEEVILGVWESGTWERFKETHE